jgi:hypothetical protein
LNLNLKVCKLTKIRESAYKQEYYALKIMVFGDITMWFGREIKILKESTASILKVEGTANNHHKNVETYVCL